MIFTTKLNLNSSKIEQCSGEVLNLSGCTNIFGKFEIASGATLSILANAGTGKVLTSNSGGTVTWQTPSGGGITGATNGLHVEGKNITLGGTLTGNTTIDGVYNLSFDIDCLTVSGASGFNLRTGTDKTVISTSQVGAGSLSICSGGVGTIMGGAGIFDYCADYSTCPTFGVRTLVDKGYVDNAIWTSGSTTYGATNGLNLNSGNCIGLGGSLTGNTSIDLGANLYTLCSTASGGCICSTIVNGSDYTGIEQGSTLITLCGYNSVGPVLGVISIGGSGTCGDVRLHGENCVHIDAGTSLTCLDISQTEVLITYNPANYAADYSGSYTDRSLVDKGYVDNAIWISGGTSGYTFTNGLTLTSGAVCLGGVLTEALTVIDAGANEISICNASFYGFNVNSTRAILGDIGVTAGHVYVDTTDVKVCGNAENVCLSSGALISLQVASAGCLDITTACNTFTDAASKGLVYAGDYCGQFTCLSLVSANYVSGCTAAMISASAVTATNGLNKNSGNCIGLGGDLTGTTIINTTSTYDFSITSSGIGLNVFGTGGGVILGDCTCTAEYLKLCSGLFVDTKTNDTSIITTGGGRICVSNASDCVSMLTTAGSYICVTNTCVDISGFGGAMTVTDNVAKGLVYAGDYRTQFTQYSLVDAGWASGCSASMIAAATGGTLTYATNGLNKNSGNCIGLGGTLTGDTVIDTTTNAFCVYSSTNSYGLRIDNAGCTSIGHPANAFISVSPTDNVIAISANSITSIKLTPQVNIIRIDNSFSAVELNGYILTLSGSTATNLCGNVYMCNLPPKTTETCVVYIDAAGMLSTGTGGGIGWSNLTNGSTVAGCGTPVSGGTLFCNTFYGVCAGMSTTTGTNNVAVGYRALYCNTSGCTNVAIGSQALIKNTIGSDNTAIGNQAMFNNTIGSGNIAIGIGSLYYNTTGCTNIAIGNSVLQNNTIGYNNTAIGFSSLMCNISGHDNFAVGFSALRQNLCGSYNIAIGYLALYFNTGGTNNIANGACALQNNLDGCNNIAIGVEALKCAVLGNNNIGIGCQTLLYNSGGTNNVAIGTCALQNNKEGCNNLAHGYGTLLNNTCGNDNVALGNSALYTNIIGCNNTAVGSYAGFNMIGCNNVAVGSYAGFYETGSNKLYIANNYTCSLIYGEFDNKYLKLDSALHVIATGSTCSNKLRFVEGNQGLGKVLTSDADGYATWQIASGGIGWSNLTNGSTVAGCGTVASGGTICCNTIYGVCAGASLTTGLDNVAIGTQALANSSGDTSNIAIGTQALYSNVGGDNNIAHGTHALQNNLIGNGNIAIGYSALYNSLTDNNIGIGFEALYGESAGIGYSNLAIGNHTLYYNNSGCYNIAIGDYALLLNNSGNKNLAFGAQVLQSNSSGSDNVGIGFQSLNSNTGGTGNIANGICALFSNKNGNYNIATGYRALLNNITGNYNIAIGFESMSCNLVGNYNIALGYNALQTNTSGNTNIAFGVNTLYNNTTGCDNIAFGAYTLYCNTTGCGNVAYGGSALQNNLTGCFNVANGYQALAFNTTGSDNVANGACALYSNSASNNNIAFGYAVLYNNTGGTGNIGNGADALYWNKIGNNNIALGCKALYNNVSGCDNVGIGYQVLCANTCGTKNIAIGYQALLTNTNGVNNIGIGECVLRGNNNICGIQNIGIGTCALLSNRMGQYNVGIGYTALKYNVTGCYNVGIGYQAGYNETGSNKLYIANNSGCSLIYGEFDTKRLVISGTTEIVNGTCNYLYLGNKDTDGSWRFVTSGASLVVQYRTGGAWGGNKKIAP
ncbi:MAG: hypothetical protein WC428_00470 [Candidatus Paceibacterota bacterium]